MGAKRSWMLGISLLACGCGMVAMGCGSEDTGAGAANVTASTERWAMPEAIMAYQDATGWGTHHLQWHTERHWNLLDPSGKKWATKQGWHRANVQEGEPGNGLEFLAMHRAMIERLTTKFPKQKKLFTGWTKVPTNPDDKTSPVPDGREEDFAEPMRVALDKLSKHIGDFETDDELGLFLETRLRPEPGDPRARTSDQSAGIHNYLHNRFMDPNSSIDVGDPSVNLKNKLFWRLHGWIDARWTAFRAAKGLSDSDPEYVGAMQKAREEIDMLESHGTPKGMAGAGEPPPESLTKSFEQEDSLDE